MQSEIAAVMIHAIFLIDASDRGLPVSIEFRVHQYGPFRSVANGQGGWFSF
jgi:hypothetical protein